LFGGNDLFFVLLFSSNKRSLPALYQKTSHFARDVFFVKKNAN